MTTDIEVFKHTLQKMSDGGIRLADLGILKRELADTIANYCFYLAIWDIRDHDEHFELSTFLHKHRIPSDAMLFLRDNCHKIAAVAKSIGLLKAVKKESDEEFELLQKCLIVFLGKHFEWNKVMKMREIFGLRRNLLKKNKAILIPNLYGFLTEL